MKFTMDIADLYRALDSTYRAIYDKPKERPTLACLRIEVVGRDIFFVATDGHYLVRYLCDTPLECQAGAVTISRQDVKSLLTILKPLKTRAGWMRTVTVTCTNDIVRVKHADGVFKAQEQTEEVGNYPDWRRVVGSYDYDNGDNSISKMTIATDLLWQVTLCFKAAQIVPEKKDVGTRHVPGLLFEFGEDNLTPVRVTSDIDAPNLQVTICPLVPR